MSLAEFGTRQLCCAFRFSEPALSFVFRPIHISGRAAAVFSQMRESRPGLVSGRRLKRFRGTEPAIQKRLIRVPACWLLAKRGVDKLVIRTIGLCRAIRPAFAVGTANNFRPVIGECARAYWP
jgi:hypothetical protein